jgi:branched-chain amino acid transport system permease protein
MQALYGQILLGLINGAYYALLSLGLSVIFGLLKIVNFAHGVFFMLGALLSCLLLDQLGIGYWWSLLFVPPLLGLCGMALQITLLRPLQELDHLYGLLATFGFALIVQGLTQIAFGSAGLPYAIPQALQGGQNLGFMILPNYRTWVILVSLALSVAIYLLVERTSLGALLRASTENADRARSFGINVSGLVTLSYGLGIGLAAFAGVLAAPMLQVRPLMGADLMIVVFAVVVIGGMGSILGSIVTGFSLGMIEGLTRYIFPEASNTIVFVLMALVLAIRPNGLFGKVDP